MVDQDDKTPADWSIPRDGFIETWIKRPVRRFAYPSYVKWTSRRLEKRYASPFVVDHWLWGQRGNDYETHRRRIDRVFGIEGKRVLIIGCGTGKDIPSWIGHKPQEIVGVDYFNYERAWSGLRKHFAGDVELSFFQGDVAGLDSIEDHSVDIVASDAVFEHIRNMPGVLQEIYRLLKPGGGLYATFGPLWNCWGGDHVSGSDILENGYNHLLLSHEEYGSYLDSFGSYSHCAEDGRTWIRNDLFSYYSPVQYIEALGKAGFDRRYASLVIEPKAVECLQACPEKRAALLQGHDELDLVATGMTILFSKPT